MTIEKINFHYPKKNLQSVYSHEEMTALELAAATSGKVDECVEMVNGVEQSAIEARQIVDTMRNEQDNFILENDDARAQLIIDNQTFIETLETSKETFEADLTAAKETFETNMAAAVNDIISNAETSIDTNVNEKIDELVNDGTINDLINTQILGDVKGNFAITQETIAEATGYGIIDGLEVLPQSNPDLSVLITSGTAHLYNGKRYDLMGNKTISVSPAEIYPRIDIIYISENGLIMYGKGQAAATPTPPTPTNSLILAEIKVNVGTTSINGDSITDKRSYKKTIDKIINQHLTKSIYDYPALNDTEMFNRACSIKNNEVFIPDGIYDITDEITLNEGVMLKGSKHVFLNFITDKAKFNVNCGCEISGLSINLKDNYNNSVFEISSKTLSKTFTNRVDVNIKDIRVNSTRNYDNQRSYEGAIFEIFADKNYTVKGFWNITIEKIILDGFVKYFSKNYYETGTWVTGVTFNEITIDSVKYGWFGAKDEATIESGIYKDPMGLVLNNIYFQADGTEHVVYFTHIRKNMKNMIIWDWVGDTQKYCISKILAETKTQKVLIDKVFNSVEDDFYCKTIDKAMSDFYMRRLIECGSVNYYLGNKKPKDMKEHNKSYREFGILASTPAPLWFKAKMFVSGGGTVIRGMLNLYDSESHEIVLRLENKGGHWYCAYTSKTNIQDKIEIYALVTTVTGGKTVDLYFKFNYNMGAYAFYSTLAKTDWWDEIALTYVNETPDTTGYTKCTPITKGAYIPKLPTAYIPFLSLSGETNYMAQKDNRVVYKTENAIQETIPKIRVGVQIVNTTPIPIVFTDIGTDTYKIFLSGNTSPITITAKSSTGFTMEATKEETVNWLVII